MTNFSVKTLVILHPSQRMIQLIGVKIVNKMFKTERVFIIFFSTWIKCILRDVKLFTEKMLFIFNARFNVTSFWMIAWSSPKRIHIYPKGIITKYFAHLFNIFPSDSSILDDYQQLWKPQSLKITTSFVMCRHTLKDWCIIYPRGNQYVAKMFVMHHNLQF